MRTLGTASLQSSACSFSPAPCLDVKLAFSTASSQRSVGSILCLSFSTSTSSPCKLYFYISVFLCFCTCGVQSGRSSVSSLGRPREIFSPLEQLIQVTRFESKNSNDPFQIQRPVNHRASAINSHPMCFSHITCCSFVPHLRVGFPALLSGIKCLHQLRISQEQFPKIRYESTTPLSSCLEPSFPIAHHFLGDLLQALSGHFFCHLGNPS